MKNVEWQVKHGEGYGKKPDGDPGVIGQISVRKKPDIASAPGGQAEVAEGVGIESTMTGPMGYWTKRVRFLESFRSTTQ